MDGRAVTVASHKSTIVPSVFTQFYLQAPEWANNRNESGLSIRTLTDRARYWKFLSPVYGQILVNAILPVHMLPYFHKRVSKVSAKKELKFLSVIMWRTRGWR
jgi:hypothetical protein